APHRRDRARIFPANAILDVPSVTGRRPVPPRPHTQGDRTMPGTSFPAARLAVAGLLLSAAPALALPEPAPAAPASRTLEFTYAATTTGVPAGKTARVWVPLASSDDYQDVKVVAKKLPPGGKVGKDKLYGNEMEYVEAKAGPDGKIPLEVVYRVTRKEVRFDDL